MLSKPGRPALLLAAAAALSCVSAAPNAGQASPAAEAAAAGPLRRSLQALGGGEAVARARAFRARLAGTSYASEQARSPAQPVARASRVYRFHFDGEGRRVVRDSEQIFPGRIRFLTRTAFDSDGGWSVDLLKWRNGTDLQSASREEAAVNRAQYERYFPHLLVRQAMEPGARLETVDPARFRFRDASGATIEVRLDAATGLPASSVQIVGGKVQTELTYADYVSRQGIRIPGRIRLHAGGLLREDLELGKSALAALPAAASKPPPGYAPAPAAGPPRATEVSPNLFFFESMPPFNYHSMAVDQGDRILLLEAPSSPAYAEVQKRLLAELRPGRPVTHVLVTHHHGDHIGGLRAWVEAGATVVAARGAGAAIERQLRSGGYSGPLKLEEVDGTTGFGAGETRVDAHAFASSHAEAHLLLHLPATGILFQGDLFYLPERGPVPPAFEGAAELARQLDRLELDVRRIFGVHGRPGTREDLRKSLAARRRR